MQIIQYGNMPLTCNIHVVTDLLAACIFTGQIDSKFSTINILNTIKPVLSQILSAKLHAIASLLVKLFLELS